MSVEPSSDAMTSPYPPIVITGMSGAGLSSAGRVLEDMGWFVVQNLPPQLVLNFVEQFTAEDSPNDKVAVVSDVRALHFNGTLDQVLDSLRERGLNPLVIFMDARDDVLVKRFDNLRRTHPLQGNGTLLTGINREREIMNPLRESADLIIDTSDKSVHDLRRAIEASFSSINSNVQHVTVQSFGFKHGAPRDVDIVMDMRFLPNPFWIPELRPFRGVDRPVADYVLGQELAKDFLENFEELFKDMRRGFQHEGKKFITIGVGCTGGHHRSVAIAEELGNRLRELDGIDVSVVHRDIERD